jgi:hypothetical protein
LLSRIAVTAYHRTLNPDGTGVQVVQPQHQRYGGSHDGSGDAPEQNLSVFHFDFTCTHYGLTQPAQKLLSGAWSPRLRFSASNSLATCAGTEPQVPSECARELNLLSAVERLKTSAAIDYWRHLS